MSKVSNIILIEKEKNTKLKRIERDFEKKLEKKILEINNDFKFKKEKVVAKVQRDFLTFKKLISLKIEKKIQDKDVLLEELGKKVNIEKISNEILERGLK